MRVARGLRWLLAGVLVLLVAAAVLDRAHANDATADGDDVRPGGGDDADSKPAGPVVTLEGLTPEQEEALRQQAPKFQFQAEVNRMMKLIINSLYKNKEIFLRELISNASDALDKIRFLSLTHRDALAGGADLKIQIRADRDKKTITITDTGVGMTRDELVKNLGTLAKSGTADFVSAVEQSGDMSLIGQFGVGFYSAFLVADRVTVVSKSNNDDQHVWESNAETDFTVFKDPRGNTLGRGTQITLQVKEDAQMFLEDTQLRDLVRKYSEFINFPIYLWTHEPAEPGDEEDKSGDAADADEDAADHAAEKKDDDDSDDVKDADDEDEDKEKEEKNKKPKEPVYRFVRQNKNKPIWTRSPDEVTEEDYREFYKLFMKHHDTRAPMAHTHFRAEGEVEFKALLFVPAKAPATLYSASEAELNFLKLFVKRVFITDDVPELLPRWLKFLRGVVDSDDLPLNVSRETLQQHKLLRVMRRKLVRKAIDLFRQLSEDEEEYEEFLKEYHTSLKLGIVDDATNRKRLAELIRFKTSTSNGKYRSLAEYVESRKKGQDVIFFVAGTSFEDVEASPFIERLKARGYEVLYMIEPIDEYVVQSLADYEGFRFQNIAKEGLKFGDEDDAEDDNMKTLEEKFEPLTKWFVKVLSANIDKSRVSNRLTTSPAALIVPQFGVSGNMERIMRSQAYASPDDPTTQYFAKQKKILEINPKHPVIQELLNRVQTGQDGDESTKELAQILFDTSALRSGFFVPDTVAFATRIERVLRANLDVDLDAQVEVNEKPAPEPALNADGEEDEGDDEGYEEEARGRDHDEL